MKLSKPEVSVDKSPGSCLLGAFFACVILTQFRQVGLLDGSFGRVGAFAFFAQIVNLVQTECTKPPILSTGLNIAFISDLVLIKLHNLPGQISC